MSTDPAGRPLLDYEQTLSALLGFVGDPVIVTVSGASGEPPEAMALLMGPLRRAASSPLLDFVYESVGIESGELLLFQVGDRDTYFALIRDDFIEGVWMRQGQLVVRVGACEFTIMRQLGPGGES